MRQIKAIQLDRAGKRVVAVAVLPRTELTAVPSSSEVSRLAATLERAGFAGRQVVLTVPSDKLLSDVFELPRTAGAPVEQMARLELARAHRCAPDSLEVGAWELPTNSRAARSAQVMAVACRHDDANPLLETFDQHGLEVVALDARFCALARAVSSLAQFDDIVTGVLDFGWSAASLVLLYRDTVVYERKISESGLSRLHAELCQRLTIDTEVADYLLSDVGLIDTTEQPVPPEARTHILAHLDALASEMLASFQYAGHQYDDAPLGQLFMSGGGAEVPAFPQHLENLLGVPVRALTPAELSPAACSGMELCKSPTMLSALGLAMFMLPNRSKRLAVVAAA